MLLLSCKYSLVPITSVLQIETISEQPRICIGKNVIHHLSNLADSES